MALLDLFTKRYAVRAYKPDEVEHEKLQLVLEAARLAPTAANRQAFKLIVIKTAGRHEELKQIYAKDWFVQPPYILGIALVKGADWERRGDQKTYGEVDVGIVFDHLVLEASELGLGTCWIGAFDPAAATRVLQLEPNWEPLAFTPLGYPADEKTRKIRKPLADLVVYR
ncbi:MAG: nitroreductase family protein [Ethanoligenens sp.]|uniref:nitroreductase family protein n=1 Tax=Ethanoligenens sp. TaxID=2099655 RepID=UPI0039ED0181